MSDETLYSNTCLVPGKGYRIEVGIGDEHIILTPTRALAYCQHVLAVIARADYDAAVIKQMTTKLHMPQEKAVQLVLDLRRERPPLSNEATRPFVFIPIVSSKTGEPHIDLESPKHGRGQISAVELLDHVRYVLACIEVADLDSAYYRLLRGVIDIEDTRAQNVIADLANFRAT